MIYFWWYNGEIVLMQESDICRIRWINRKRSKISLPLKAEKTKWGFKIRSFERSLPRKAGLKYQRDENSFSIVYRQVTAESNECMSFESINNPPPAWDAEDFVMQETENGAKMCIKLFKCYTSAEKLVMPEMLNITDWVYENGGVQGQRCIHKI